MALCCIGGVCIPYTALLPLLVLGLQWLLKQLSAAGLLPTSWTSTLNHYLSSNTTMAGQQQRGAKDSSSSLSCCGTNNKNGKSHLRRGKQTKVNDDSSSCCADATTTTPTAIVHCATEEEWERLVQRSTTLPALAVKFTAAWCKPCQKIQPVFAALSQQNDADYNTMTTTQKIQLVTVDVDGCDNLAGSLQILSLPTFMLLDPRTQRPIGPSSSYSGSDEARLQLWWESAIASVKKMS